jgi:type VI secretion system protein ImpG
MRDELLTYYERELSFIRQMGAEFADKYPKIASRLLLESDRCEDPHVERLIEAFSFLAARVHLRIDDDFPEVTESLLNILYPHYLRPIPSTTIVEFTLDPEQGKLSTSFEVPKGTTLYTRPFEGIPCRFRLCYPVRLLPLTVADAQWRTPDRLQNPLKAADAVAALRVELHCLPDVTFAALKPDSLRFYLSGDSNLVHSLYELLLNNCLRILIRPLGPKQGGAIQLPASALRPVGFGPDEDVLPYPRRSFVGYRLLQEYFSVHEKFLFVDLTGLEGLASGAFGDRAEIIFLFSEFELAERQQVLETNVSAKTLRLGCAPAINLFPQTAEPILLDQTRFEYPVIPDLRRRQYIEIYSVDEVVSSRPDSTEVTQYQPFYAYRHASGRETQTFWHTSRRLGGGPSDESVEISLSLVDLSGKPSRPDADTLTVRCTCSNRDLPYRLPFGAEGGDFEMDGIPFVRKATALHKPSQTIRPPMGKGALWRLISHLSLNYLSLVDEGKEAMQEILSLYNFAESPYLRRQIQGITSLESKRRLAPVATEQGISFARGTQVMVEVDEEQFVGGGVFLFLSVLEHFLGLYTSLNSFTQLIASTKQRKEVLREWPPRSGYGILS